MGYVGPFKTEQGAPNPFRTEQICVCVRDLYSTQLTKKVITGIKVNGPWRELRRWVGPTSKVRALGGRGGEVSWEPGLWVWEQGQRLAPKPSVLSARVAQEDRGVSSFSLVLRPLQFCCLCQSCVVGRSLEHWWGHKEETHSRGYIRVWCWVLLIYFLGCLYGLCHWASREEMSQGGQGAQSCGVWEQLCCLEHLTASELQHTVRGGQKSTYFSN